MRFSKYLVVQALEAVSFWWENSIGIVIPLWEFKETVTVAETSYQMLRVLSFCNWERA